MPEKEGIDRVRFRKNDMAGSLDTNAANLELVCRLIRTFNRRVDIVRDFHDIIPKTPVPDEQSDEFYSLNIPAFRSNPGGLLANRYPIQTSIQYDG